MKKIQKNKPNSILHAIHFIEQYRKRYGISKFFRVLFHYGYIGFKKISLKPKDDLIEVNGYKMSIIPEDLGISKELQTFKIHEPLSTYLISKILKKDMCCLDIGANIGYYVLLESQRIGQNGRVIAIEPSPQNFKYLKQNVTLQNSSNVDVFNFAAGDSNGNIRFFVNLRSNGCKVLIDGEKLPNRPGDVIKVPIKIMDEFVNELNLENIDFIRMDVEGFEYHVIEGMKKTIQKFNPMIQLEVHKRHMGIENTKKFFEFFKAQNYEIKFYHNRDLDLPFIGTLKDIKQFSVDQILLMLEDNTLPNFFNIVLSPMSPKKNLK